MELLRRRFERVRARLARVEWILRGTITERLDRRERPAGSGRITTRGPYYQWTFKRQGKTVTVNLTKTQAKVYRKAINNHRKLKEVLCDLLHIPRSHDPKRQETQTP